MITIRQSMGEGEEVTVEELLQSIDVGVAEDRAALIAALSCIEDDDEEPAARVSRLVAECNEDAGEEEVKIYHNYSGRGMFGRTCLGVTTSDPDAVKETASAFGLPRPKVDNLGRQFICYWPNISG